MSNDETVDQMRRNYTQAGLLESAVDADPMRQFAVWFEQIKAADVPDWFEANAMTLATADADGEPSGRIVLLKGFDDEGFTFFTNYASEKGKDLDARPRAGLVFYWGPLERQVRITGRVERLSREASEAYFVTRPRGSQFGAIVSPQSQVVANRWVLEDRYADLEVEYADEEKTIPMPADWGGYRVVPEVIEFWQGRPSRLHDRLRYRLVDGAWVVERLAP